MVVKVDDVVEVAEKLLVFVVAIMVVAVVVISVVEVIFVETTESFT